MTENYEPEMATEAEPVEEMTWNDYTVIQLKEELNMRGLETVGKKAELVARLEKYDSDMLAQQKQEEDNGDEFVDWNVDEEQEDTQEEHGGHGDMGYLGTSNGTKASETLATSAEKTEGSSDDKPTNDAAAQKEPDPDFTVTPSKDGDMMLLTWCGKQVPIPFRDEIQKDLRYCSKMQNVMMYPVELADVLSDTFRPLIESAINVSTELDEIVVGRAIKGYLRLKFSTTSEAAKAMELLKEYKRDGQELTIKFFAEDDSEGHILSKIRKDETERKGPLITRLLFVGNLPAGFAEEALKDCFPDGVRAIIPSKENEDASQKSGGYAYMEYASETDATEAAKKYQDVELGGHRLYVIRAMTERMMSFGLLKDSLRKYWLQQIRDMEATKSKAHNKTPREQAELDTKLDRMKRRIKKDNQRRELLNIPVPESEAVEVPDSDTEKEKDGEDKAKEEKPKEEGKPSERHSHREERSAERRRTPPPRRRPSPPRYRGSYRGGSRGGYRGGPPSYGGNREMNADRLVDQLQELVGALAHRDRSTDYGGRGGYYEGPPPRGGRGGYGGPSYRGDYHSSSSRFQPKRPSDSGDYAPERKRHVADDYYGGGRGGGGYGSYGGSRRGGYY